jgi:mono/diheme cytochrome c family protein
MKKALRVLGILLLVLIVAVGGIAAYIKFALPDVGPAPQLTVKKDSAHIERGRYLANHVMICMDCHSTRDWNTFAGPLVAGTLGKGGEIFDKRAGFPGTYISANITPAGVGNWTDGELFRAITAGVKKDGSAIFPVMPHKNYGQLDPEDIESVIAYVRTLQPIENQIPPSQSDFPMNFIINTIPSKPAFTSRPDSNDLRAYGKYLVTAAACADCHTPFEKGSYVEELHLAGGRVFDMPPGTLTSMNITFDKETGIGSWTKEMFIRKFASFRDSAAANQKVDFMKEYNTIMPWAMYGGMTDHDLEAIYEYLKSVKPIKNKVTRFVPRTAEQANSN